MKKISIVALSGLIFLLGGCASSGNQILKEETEASISAKITENKTTKEDVRKIFGSPDETTFTDNGKEIWKYRLIDVSVDGVNFIPLVGLFGSSQSGTKKELVVMFTDDVVYKYSMSEAPHAIKTGIFK